MGWATYVDATIMFNRETYNSKYQVEDELDELRKEELMHRDNLMLLIGANPDSFREKDCEGEDINPLDTVRSRASEAIEELQNIAVKKYELYLLLDNWDKRSGDFVKKENDDEDESED